MRHYALSPSIPYPCAEGNGGEWFNFLGLCIGSKYTEIGASEWGVK